jgi:putative colanic acid biosynthesis acetyltransferase WcaF
MSDAADSRIAGRGRTDLSTYSSRGFERGASALAELVWMLVSAIFFRHSLAVCSGWKVGVLRAFGAEVGRGVVIKPSVQIKFPWKLRIGNHVWIGEHVWIDNLDRVTIGDSACLSQGAMLLCGNHDFTKTTFDLVTRPITIEEGAWVGARAIVGPGVRMGSHAVLTAGSVATRDLEPYTIYQGNPADPKKPRLVGEAGNPK